MCFVTGKWRLIYDDNSCLKNIGIYSQVDTGLYNLPEIRHSNQLLK